MIPPPDSSDRQIVALDSLADTDFGALRLPMIAAPMTLASTPSLVGAACAAGVMGAFPTSNAPSSQALDEWFEQIAAETVARRIEGYAPGPVVANLIVGRQNTRLDNDVDSVIRHRVGMVITSVGNPAAVIPSLKEHGVKVFVDVASMRHVERSLEAGADGLVLLAAGAGGHTGWANPFAFAGAVRRVSDVPMVMAGGGADGAALWAAVTLGFSASLVGTRLIATPESGVGDAWREAIVDASMDEITVERAAHNAVAASLLTNGSGSAGHSVSCVDGVYPAIEVIAQLEAEYRQARARTATLLS